MRIKEGVRLHGVRNEITWAAMIIDSVYKTFSRELVVTSVSEGKHSETSAHYRGDGLDARTYYFDESLLPKVKREVKKALGGDFFVKLEKDHLHVEWRPKKL